MNWFPIGPDFVFQPNDLDFIRLSARNEAARQCRVEQIVIDPTDDSTIYLTGLTWWGGFTAFRSNDRGMSWVRICQDLQQERGAFIDPKCIAVNPEHPSTVYLGTNFDGGFYVSNHYGDPGTWSVRTPVGGYVTKLVVDPSSASDLAKTVIYAATDSGVFRSEDGGLHWVQVLPGYITSLATHFAGGGAQSYYYAGVSGQGVFLATTPPLKAADWVDLNKGGDLLPINTGGTEFGTLFVDYCLRNPACAYAYYLTPDWQYKALYSTTAPFSKWTLATPAEPPKDGCVPYARVFAVAPNSPGDGTGRDILFLGGLRLNRSTDSGNTWKKDDASYFGNIHGDVHTFAFVPAKADVPRMYQGDDGGIAMSTRACDPAFAIDALPPHFNELEEYDPGSGAWQNLNHSRLSSNIMQYASDPVIGAIGYIGCQDTGLAGGSGALGWRALSGADVSSVASVHSNEGVKVWYSQNGLTTYRVDRGKYDFNPQEVLLDADSSVRLASTSNHIVDDDGNCLTGCVVLSKFVNGWTSPTNAFVARIKDGVATQISQEFFQSGKDRVFWIAKSPVNPNILYCATYPDTENHVAITWAPSDGVMPGVHKLWTTENAENASAGTVWMEVKSDKPTDISIASVCIDVDQHVYVLLDRPASSSGSPLYRIEGGKWVAQQCTGLPNETKPSDFPDWVWSTYCDRYRKLVADPFKSGVLYASYGARVYELKSTGTSSWTWTDISAGLPGQWVYDLWVGDIGGPQSGAPVGEHKALLRAAVITSGVWETDLSKETGASPFPYLRKNILDQGWLHSCPEGVSDPHDPASQVWHYQCADIKIDVQQPGNNATGPFFQTEPEGTIPLSHVHFDMMRDNSQNLPGMTAANVHVQVRNRSYKKATVRVWAIFCNAAAGVPALNARADGSTFDFWSQFAATGEILPKLPADSLWKSIGTPQMLIGLDAENPKVASWPWTIPTLDIGDPGHYCMVAFVHSAENPINESSMDVDTITPLSPRIGQKNVHVVPLAADGQPGAGGSVASLQMEEYIEFHNPTNRNREALLVFDFRRLPPEIQVNFQLTKLQTANSRPSSVTGVARTYSVQPRPRPRHRPGVATANMFPVVYRCKASALVHIDGVPLPRQGFEAALLTLRNTGRLQPGREYRFEVQQLVGEKVVGGSSYVLRIAGDKKGPHVVSFALKEDVERIAKMWPAKLE